MILIRISEMLRSRETPKCIANPWKRSSPCLIFVKHPKPRIIDFWRVFRTGFFLLAKPTDIPWYLIFSVGSQKSPLQLGMPWWSFGAVKALEGHLHREQRVFEFGSGGSTIYLASRTAKITSVEDDSHWIAAVTKEAKRRGLQNLDVLYRPFDFWHTDAFPDSSYLNALGNDKFDIIIVDGREWTDQIRDLCFWKAERHVLPGGIIIVDDFWRYPQIRVKNRSKRWVEYKGPGYCRKGITSTAIFEYD